MQTKVSVPSEETYRLAAAILHNGGLVAFPTETVYGLGADALNSDAVLSVFEAKSRPADNPLIVHISDKSMLDAICFLSKDALQLATAFWPGPLTLLLHKKPIIPNEVTAGLDTVAVRMPSHPAALKMLQTCGLPVAAPSANLSGRPSPTTAAHVLDDLNGRIPLIIDGGSCDIGLESTVLDLSRESPCILRPGAVTSSMLESVLGIPVSIAGSTLRPLRKDEPALSPGMKHRHYAPKGEITLIEGCEQNVLSAMRKLYLDAAAEHKRVCILCFSEHLNDLNGCLTYSLGSRNDLSEIARRLFDILRRLDDENMELIFSEALPPVELGLAIMNRLARAAAFKTIHV